MGEPSEVERLRAELFAVFGLLIKNEPSCEAQLQRVDDLIAAVRAERAFGAYPEGLRFSTSKGWEVKQGDQWVKHPTMVEGR